MGAFLGIVLGWTAVVGSRPVPPFKDILGYLVRIMAITACGALVVGVFTALSRYIAPAYVMRLAISEMSPDIQRRFTIDLFIHNASYDVAPTATAVYAVLIYRSRMVDSGRSAVPDPSPRP